MKKVLFVFGTRPEAIKMAPLIKIFKEENRFNTVICVTAQHRQMLDQVLKIFDIIPDYDLDLMKNNQDLFDISAGVINGIKPIFDKEKPDYVFVQGDTTTTVMGALAAFYYKSSVCHIEAGLRTNNVLSPWPEEMNRQITSRIADFHFAPTQLSKLNLIKENIPEQKIFITGNTGIDTLLSIKKTIETNNSIKEEIIDYISTAGYCIKNNKKIILITGHRRENFGRGFEGICTAIKSLAKRNPDMDFIYPVHLNPNVQVPVRNILGGIKNIYLLKPFEYLPFVYLMLHSFLILTDSGGIQEEAPSLGKPVLVLRETTERTEAVLAGTVKIVGTNSESIIEETENLLFNHRLYNQISHSINPYGDGSASRKILEILLNNNQN